MKRPLLLILIPLLFSSLVYAAPPDSGSLLREQQQSPIKLPDQLPKPDESAVERAPLTDTAIKVVVKGFRFKGIAGLATGSELQELLKGAIGKEQGLADLQKLAQQVTSYLREKGFFLARAYLPRQDITEGIIEIAVISGRVDGGATIRTKAPSRINNNILQSMINNGVRSGQPLEEKQLERSLMLINDLPGVSAKGTLERGTTYGSTKVLIDATEGSLFSGGISADNFGNRYTGSWRGTGFASVNDPFGIGDQLSLTMIGAENLYQGKVGYSAQILPNGLKGNLSFNALYYKLGEELASLDAHGYANTISAGFNYPILRSRAFSLWTNVTYEYRMLDDYASGSITKDRDIHAGTADLSSSSYDQLGGGALTSVRLSVTTGNLQLGNSTDAQTDATTAKTAGSYAKFNYSVARLQRLIKDVSLFGSVSGQLATGNLDSSEKFILGGPTGVRSYPVGEASSDEGHSFTVELRYDTPLPTSYGSLQLVGFLDTGTVTLHKELWTNAVTTATGKNSYWLTGSGIGLNYSLSKRFALRGTWARTIGSNDGRSTTGKDADNYSENNRFWLQATAWF
jgi:hemolysin activation/secretion protein